MNDIQIKAVKIKKTPTLVHSAFPLLLNQLIILSRLFYALPIQIIIIMSFTSSFFKNCELLSHHAEIFWSEVSVGSLWLPHESTGKGHNCKLVLRNQVMLMLSCKHFLHVTGSRTVLLFIKSAGGQLGFVHTFPLVQNGTASDMAKWRSTANLNTLGVVCLFWV